MMLLVESARDEVTGSLTFADGSEQPLRQNLAIGRGPGNHIRLSSKMVSRRHALLKFEEGRWYIEDRGSVNGTFVNETRLPFGVPHPLRHADRITVGSETLVFSWPAEAEDRETTDRLKQPVTEAASVLSPFQLQVVRALCGAWLGGTELDRLPSNEQIAAQLGTPEASESVKASLRRIYAKAGLSDVPPHAKRRMLCRVARQRGWL
jgi:pSer/pThr/pTyr-binding forkhead associated (FHA) protein